MAVNLTGGAITMMCSDDSYSEDLKPVLQVVDVKLLPSQQNSAAERYLLVLSDGLNYNQGMLVSTKNSLVYSGRLQKGSVVMLTQFVCNVVQNRKIIIIIELDVVLQNCDLIGEPVPTPRSIPAAQPASVHPKPNHASSNTQPEAGVTLPFNGSYGYQNMGFRNTQPEASRPIQNSCANTQPMARDETPPRVISIAAMDPHQNMWGTVLDIRCRCNLIFSHLRSDIFIDPSSTGSKDFLVTVIVLTFPLSFATLPYIFCGAFLFFLGLVFFTMFNSLSRLNSSSLDPIK